MRFLTLALFVQKYGGTSVGTLERIKAVAEHLSSIHKAGHKLLVVVSAMGQQTDELLDMALDLNDQPPQRELDMLLSAGERISMSLLAIALSKLEVPTVSFTGSQSGILTDNVFGNARIIRILGDRIKRALELEKIVIVAGFQGMSELEKEITTLGRGGSDLTAIALAHTLQADRCQIFKDVDGVCSADPRLVQSAKILPFLSWDSLNHLTWFGSGVVHNRGVHLSKKFRIPLEIRSSFNLNTQGTLIGGRKEVENAIVYALTHRTDLIWLKIYNLSQFSSHLTFKALAAMGEHPLYFIHSRVHNKDCLDLVISQKHLANLQETLNQSEKGLVYETQVQNLACLTLVGDGFWQDATILKKSATALSKSPVLVDYKNAFLNLFIEKEGLSDAIAALHAEFFN